MNDRKAEHAAMPLPTGDAGHSALSDAFLRKVEAAIGASDGAQIATLAGDLHPADLGTLITALGADARPAFIELLADRFDFAALTEIDETIRDALLDTLPAEQLARGIGSLDSGDAAFLLADLTADERAGVLRHLSDIDRHKLTRALDYPEDSAGRLMQTDFVAVPPFWTVGQTIDFLREAVHLPDRFFEILVVDAGFHLCGSLALDTILRTGRRVRISDIQKPRPHSIPALADKARAAWLFERYDLVSLAVTDADSRLVGVLGVDDMVEVIQAETEEDMRALAGLGDEEISGGIADIAGRRISWLFVNLFTALLTSLVISLFETTIAAMVALAVLMPVIASLGGNAAVQTMTITVRAIATRRLGQRNVWRVLGRELCVAIINGTALGTCVAVIALLWYHNGGLALVIGAAILFNTFCAGLAGVTIPLGLDRLRIDPAVASTVFVTMITDIGGFFGFLALAAWWLGLPAAAGFQAT